MTHKHISKKLTAPLLAGAMIFGTAMATQPAQAEDGFFLKPGASIIFSPKEASYGANKIGVGGGIDFLFGYQFDAWQWDMGFAYYAEGGKNRKLPNNGRADITRQYLPITTGINYTFPFLSSVDTTIGIGGGVMLQFLDNKFRLASGNYNDNATVVSGLLVPKFSLDYVITDNWVVNFESKFYLLFGGYNAVAASDAGKAAARAIGIAVPKDRLLWFGTITVDTTYRF